MRIDRMGWVAMLVTVGLLASAGSRAAGLAGSGVRAGLTVSNLRGDFADFVGTRTRTGFAGGGFLRLGLGGPLEVQPELLYVMKGAKTRNDVTDGSGTLIGTADLTYQFDYLEIPLLLRVTIPAAGRPSLLFGPSLGVKVRSRLSYNGPGPDQSADFEPVDGADYGLVGGIVFSFGHGVAHALLDARYTLGLREVITPPNLLEARTSTFAITAGLGF